MTNRQRGKTQYGNRESLKAIAVSVFFIFAMQLLSAQAPLAPLPDTSGIATGVSNFTSDNSVKMWSYENKVMVDLTSEKPTETTLALYLLSGQLILEEKFMSGGLYTRQIENPGTGYVIVCLRNNGQTFNRTLFVANSK